MANRLLPGFNEAYAKVNGQSQADDLALIDNLYGRENLRFGDGPSEIKAEALRQLERDFTVPA